ncbi:MAG: hypothetical protein Q4A18_03925 [Rikenellaceae bacterium]|nr:hypothetical protein [Rikenellaceae bacterium]
MNKYIKQLVSLAAVALVSWGCESDFYNEHMIDGYEPETEITDVQSIEYTLTEDDYSTISKNSTNKTNAEAAGQEAVDALAAIGRNKYFSTPDEAAAYVPAFLASAYPTLDNNSIVMVTYTTALDIPEEIQKMNAATEYTLTEENYQTIWGEEEYVKAVTPATEAKVASVLSSEGLEAGDYVAVTYNYSAEEPSTEEEPDTPEDPEQPEEPTVEFPGEGQYLIVALTGETYYTMCHVPADKGYGYPKSSKDLTPENSTIAANETSNAFAFMFEEGATEGQFHIREVSEASRYYYNSGTYKNFSVNATLDAASTDYAFTVTLNEDGSVHVTNVSTGRTLQQGDGSYDSYGLYDTQLGSYPHLYKLNDEGTAYVDIATLKAEPTNNYTSVLGSAVLNDAVEVKGYISAVSSQGPILTDNGGSVLLYKTTGYELGDELTVKGTISSFNFGFQIGTSGISIEKTGTTTVTYPTAMEITGAKADELLTTRTADEYAYYAKMTGTVSVSGNYYNFNLDGATTAVGSIYGATDEVKSWLSDGQQCTIYGYFVSISKQSGSPKFVNIIVTSVENVSAASEAAKTATVTSEKKYAYYKWNGTAFEAANIVAVQPADYTEMGNKYGSFTNPDQDKYLPKFLGKTNPYAMEGDVAYVAYRCYASGSTSWKVDEYINDGTVWNKTIYFASKTDQFRKNEGVWAIDRTLELDYTGNGADTKAFYQYCVNWVYDNKDVPMGAPARDNAGVIVSTDIVMINGEKPAGNYWVSNYGNNEFYTGASAYYGNMDWRASACRGGFVAAGMGDLTDEEIVAKLQENTAEVFAAVLGYVYPEMTPADYKKVVIKVYAYGPNVNYAYTFDVVETGTFQYAEGSMTVI